MTDCPICRSTKSTLRPIAGEWQLVDCPRCGTYRISFEAIVNMGTSDPLLRSRISATVRNSHAPSPATVLPELIDRVERGWREPTVSEKLNTLLIALADMSDYPGAEVHLHFDDDVGLAWARRSEELRFYVAALTQSELLDPPRTLDGGFSLTTAGWAKLAELSAGGRSSTTVFVAMAFAEQLQAAWIDGLHPGILSTGYSVERADSAHHNDRIDDRIMAMIRACRFLVVDATTQNRGAYFEAGFGLGLGRPVIWTVREDDLVNVHFDTRQFNHVVWKTPSDLRSKIEQRILGVFGRGPVEAQKI